MQVFEKDFKGQRNGNYFATPHEEYLFTGIFAVKIHIYDNFNFPMRRTIRYIQFETNTSHPQKHNVRYGTVPYQQKQQTNHEYEVSYF